MTKVKKICFNSFFKIVSYKSDSFRELNSSRPTYIKKAVCVLNITPIASDDEGNPLFCYELIYLE